MFPQTEIFIFSLPALFHGLPFEKRNPMVSRDLKYENEIQVASAVSARARKAKVKGKYVGKDVGEGMEKVLNFQ